MAGSSRSRCRVRCERSYRDAPELRIRVPRPIHGQSAGSDVALEDLKPDRRTSPNTGWGFFLSIILRIAPVAQLDRAPGFEPGGREFESLRARQSLQSSPSGADAASSNGQVATMTHSSSLSAVVFSADGRTLYSGATDGALHAWNADSGAHLRELAGHDRSVLHLAVSP